MLNRLIVGTALLGLGATSAFADYIQCDQKQTYCVVEAKRTVIGDTVGIFNSDKELVAVAEVSSMKNSKRRLEITKRFGTIYNGYDVRRIEENKALNLKENFKFYKAPSKISGGAGMALTKLDLAESTNAYSMGGYAQYRWKKDILVVARGHFFTASGTAIDVENSDEEEEFSVQGFSLFPGVAYEILAKRQFSFRGEFGLGMTYISSSTSGQSAARSLDKVQPGAGFASRVGLSVLYNRLGEWHPELMTEFMRIHQSDATSIGVGVMRTLK